MKLYPRLPRAIARPLATARATSSIERLTAEAAFRFTGTAFAPTGGQRVTEQELSSLRAEVVALARASGYPDTSTELRRRNFDRESAVLLYERLDLSPHEASQSGVWAFLACVLLPDVVRWRFPGDESGTRSERFLGVARGTRNALGRAWWRAYTLRDTTRSDPFEVMASLGEDELVQIMERPRVGGNCELSLALADEFLGAAASNPTFRRSEMLREVVKRLRRLLPQLAFEALEPPAVRALIRDLFTTTLSSAPDTSFGRRLVSGP